MLIFGKEDLFGINDLDEVLEGFPSNEKLFRGKVGSIEGSNIRWLQKQNQKKTKNNLISLSNIAKFILQILFICIKVIY